MVVLKSLGSAALPPRTQAAVVARRGIRHFRLVGIGREVVAQPAQQRAVVVDIVADLEALPFNPISR